MGFLNISVNFSRKTKQRHLAGEIKKERRRRRIRMITEIRCYRSQTPKVWEYHLLKIRNLSISIDFALTIVAFLLIRLWCFWTFQNFNRKTQKRHLAGERKKERKKKQKKKKKKKDYINKPLPSSDTEGVRIQLVENAKS